MSEQIFDVLSNLSSGGTSRAPNAGNAAYSQGSRPSSTAIKNRVILPEYAFVLTCADRGINVVAQMPESFTFGTNAAYDEPFKDVISGVVGALTYGESNKPLGRGIMGVARAAGTSFVTQTLSAKVWSGSETDPISIPIIFHAQYDEVEEVIDRLLALMSLTMPHSNTESKGGMLIAPGPRLNLLGIAQDATSKTMTLAAEGGKAAKGEYTKAAGQIANAGFGSWLSGTINNLWTAGKSAFNANDGTGGIASASQGFGTAALDAATDVMSTGLKMIHDTVSDNIRNRISIRLGRYMQFDNVVLKSVSQTHHVQPVGTAYGYSSGNMGRVEVTLTFEPFFDMTYNDMATVFVDPRVEQYVRRYVQGTTKYTTPGMGNQPGYRML